jgi:hypothetical protein
VQVHYNLAEPDSLGKRDQTRIRLQLAEHVAKRGAFMTGDSLLDSLFQGDPVTLPAGQRSTVYKWTQTLDQLGLGSFPELELYGVMPHMHQLGRGYRMQVSSHGEPEHCAADVKQWDFHWQRMYFYQEPIRVNPSSTISVQCDFDTSTVSEPVLPGWGTHNEMCLAALYFTVPNMP